MRLSADKNSKYYDKNRVKCVYLDGKKVDEAVEVDDHEGWVRCIRKDWAKNYKQGLTIHEKLYGKVVIFFRPAIEIITNEIDVLVMDIAANLAFLEVEVDKLKKLNEKEN